MWDSESTTVQEIDDIGKKPQTHPSTEKIWGKKLAQRLKKKREATILKHHETSAHLHDILLPYRDRNY
ncbi:hypothetical protein NECAME_04079 [Necator americanus]|uniref:Uncharacterized protein n=1 Tax=Necator americanus TaxID=51031 RepID=W2SXP1_NECAM|nr:hypothetical protein NECAME_04079 [Necator americanus]ETN74400.1 hypothetical protein NECAME_04079 [Necator americanus]